MELIILLTLLIGVLIIGYYIFSINIRKMKIVKNNEELDKIVSKFPENLDICKNVLKILDNETVKIKEEKNSKTSLYVAISNTIFIGNIKDTYTRIQTICHECLHSVQPRKLLLFNFIYSNIYLVYYFMSIILTISGIFKNIELQITILSIMSFLHYVIRSYLETDAMIKAKYLAKEYMLNYIKKDSICTENNVKEIYEEYDKINKLGITAYNYMLFFNCSIKIIIYIIIAMITLQLY